MARAALTVRAARPDDAATLLAIQRAASVAAFAHIFPPERYPFPDDDVLALWSEALGDPAVDVYVAETDGKGVGSVSVDVGESPERRVGGRGHHERA